MRLPTLFRAILEQVAPPGFAIDPFPRPLLRGRSARVVVTMGMPAFVYRLYFCAHSLKSLERNILRFAGFAPVRHNIVGSVERSAAHRQRWLDRMRALGAHGR